VCVGGISTFVCPGTSTKYNWSISGGGTKSPAVGSPCTITVQWTTAGTHYVYYTDQLDNNNNETYTINVVTASGGTITANPFTVCKGQGSTLTLTGHSGSIARWEKSSDQVNWQSIAHTGTIYSTGNLQSTIYFRAIINNCSASSQSTTRQITVIEPAAGNIMVINGSPLYCSDASSSLTLEWQRAGSIGTVKWWEYRELSTGGTWGQWINRSAGQQVNTIDFSVSVPTQILALINYSGCEIRTGIIETGPIPSTIAGVIVPSAGTDVCPNASFSLSLSGNRGNVLQWFIRDEEHGWGNLSSPNNISINRPHTLRPLFKIALVPAKKLKFTSVLNNELRC